MRAYLLAAEIGQEHEREHVHRFNAQALYDDPSVQALLDRVQYRAERVAKERIARRTANRLEKLYEQTENEPITWENAVVHGTVLRAASQFLATAAREKASDDTRRERNAMRAAIERGRQLQVDANRPPTPEEAIRHLQMLREEYGPTEFARILEAIQPKQLSE